MSRFYVTTPIYYVNALPHLGTFYTTVVADALARYHRARARSRGEDPAQSVFFLTGLDEHGQKIERIARERGMDPQAYCDGIAEKFQQTWREIGISNDAFVRTTRNAETRDHQVIENHPAAVAEMWERIAARKAPNGEPNIFAAEYDGMYCVGCEDSKTEDDVVVDGERKLCKIHLTPVERVKEKNYFFRLSAYADQLLAWYDTASRSVPSRASTRCARSSRAACATCRSRERRSSGGSPSPAIPSHTIYVWIDALTNYLTALGGPEAVARGEGRGAFWADAHHLIAKDILRLHAVYWPALLMGAELPAAEADLLPRLPDREGAEDLQVDARHPRRSHGDRRDPRLGRRRSAPLLRPARVHLRRRRRLHLRGPVPAAPVGPGERPRQPAEPDAVDGAPLRRRPTCLRARSISDGDRRRAAGLRPQTAWWDGVRPVRRAGSDLAACARSYNQKIDQAKPWVLAQGRRAGDSCSTCLAGCCEALRWAALMVAPAMPESSREILRQLGRSADEGTWPTTFGWPGGTLAEPKPVFPRIDPDDKRSSMPSGSPPRQRRAECAGQRRRRPRAHARQRDRHRAADVSIDDFAKIDLRAAKVLTAERVPKADKLLKLTLDVGAGETRTVVSGIAPAYTPETMVGRTVIYLSNLAPRKIRGVLSQGMILAAGDADVLGLSALDRDVPPGTRVR